jgi:hypothetical protein
MLPRRSDDICPYAGTRHWLLNARIVSDGALPAEPAAIAVGDKMFRKP